MSENKDEEKLCLSLAEGALGLLGSERQDAERLLALCTERWMTTSQSTERDVAIEGGRLVELLARRGAKAMPYAALGRALLADLRGADKDKIALLIEFQQKMSMLGL